MSEINWSAIEMSFEAWAKVLKNMLVEAEILSQKHQDLTAVLKKLSEFETNSSPKPPKFVKLKDFSQKAYGSLMLAGTEQRLKEIHNRLEELEGLVRAVHDTSWPPN